jgi:hypothetical protein
MLEERIIESPNVDITVGIDSECLFSYPTLGLADTHVLFENRQDGCVLNFLEAMSGRLALPSGIHALSDLKNSTHRVRFGVYRVALPEDSRGKIVIGDITFLFMFVNPEQSSASESASRVAETTTSGGATQPGYIFVSYARADAATISSPLQSVAADGRQIWYDNEIPGGAEWLALIESKIHHCHCMLVFLSNQSVNSKWVVREVQLADLEDKPILGVRIEKVELARGFRLLLAHTQIVDLWDDEFSSKLSRSLAYLTRNG